MSEPVFFPLDWRVLRLSGPDRKEFLHGLVTNDVKGLAPGRGLWCCLLTPKGKLQAHFWVYDEPEGLALVCPSESAANARAALAKMVMLSESKLEDVAQPVFWSSERGARPCEALGGSFAAARPAGRELSAAEFERLRVERGVPKYGVDADDDTIPLEARLERAISYNKGCYMGQETISRIHHLGHVNRLLVKLRGDGPLAAGAEVSAGGAVVGKVTSAAGELALAMVKREAAVDGAAVSVAGVAARVG